MPALRGLDDEGGAAVDLVLGGLEVLEHVVAHEDLAWGEGVG